MNLDRVDFSKEKEKNPPPLSYTRGKEGRQPENPNFSTDSLFSPLSRFWESRGREEGIHQHDLVPPPPTPPTQAKKKEKKKAQIVFFLQMLFSPPLF